MFDLWVWILYRNLIHYMLWMFIICIYNSSFNLAEISSSVNFVNICRLIIIIINIISAPQETAITHWNASNKHTFLISIFILVKIIQQGLKLNYFSLIKFIYFLVEKGKKKRKIKFLCSCSGIGKLYYIHRIL